MLLHHELGVSWSKTKTQNVYIDDGKDYFKSLVKGSKFFGVKGRLNNAAIAMTINLVPQMQTGCFTIELFEMCTLPHTLVEGLENRWGKIKTSEFLWDRSAKHLD